MKKYKILEIVVHEFDCDDVITTSGRVEGDETIYPVPDGWKGQ